MAPITIKTTHTEGNGRILKSEKTIRLMGIVIMRKTFHYPTFSDKEYLTKF